MKESNTKVINTVLDSVAISSVKEKEITHQTPERKWQRVITLYLQVDGYPMSGLLIEPT